MAIKKLKDMKPGESGLIVALHGSGNYDNFIGVLSISYVVCLSSDDVYILWPWRY